MTTPPPSVKDQPPSQDPKQMPAAVGFVPDAYMAWSYSAQSDLEVCWHEESKTWRLKVAVNRLPTDRQPNMSSLETLAAYLEHQRQHMAPIGGPHDGWKATFKTRQELNAALDMLSKEHYRILPDAQEQLDRLTQRINDRPALPEPSRTRRPRPSPSPLPVRPSKEADTPAPASVRSPSLPKPKPPSGNMSSEMAAHKRADAIIANPKKRPPQP